MTIATNNRARLFLMPRGVNDCLNEPIYIACVGIDGLSQDGGEINKIECPDPKKPSYKEVGIYRGEKGRMTTTITNRLSVDELALMRSIFDMGCTVDAHVHWGACTELDDFSQYRIAWVLQSIYSSNWGTDPIIAMQSGDVAPVNETLDISIGEFFQLKSQLTYAARQVGFDATGTIVDAAVYGRSSCAGDACPPSPGCDKFYAFTSDHYIEYSIDNGVNWTGIQLPVANRGVGPVGLVVNGRNVIVIYADGVVTAISRADIDLTRVGALDPDTQTWVWRTIDLGVDVVAWTNGDGVGNGSMMFIDSDGTLYRASDRNDPTCGVTEVDSVTGVTFVAMDARDGVLVAVADDGQVYTWRPGTAFAAAPTVPTASAMQTVLVKNNYNWLMGGEGGELWCTSDAGLTWKQVCFPGYSAGTPPTVTSLAMSNQHTLWMTAGGVLYRSIDGGATWAYEPNTENTLQQLTLRNMGVLSGATACEDNPNLVWGYGYVPVADPDPDTPLVVVGTAGTLW